ncbi:hypothetical protein [Hydrogenimonas sp.]
MLELFRRSIEDIFTQNFGISTESCETARPEEKGLTARIPFKEGNRNFFASLWVEKPVLERVANILLFDEKPDRETLEDLTAELANFLVGHAKMIASDRKLSCEIGTPEFTGENTFSFEPGTLLYRVEDHHIALHIREKR